MSHRNIPIFIPHLGCPHQCVFCNQRSISGHASFDRESVTREIETALSTIPEGTDTEIAFFGGSFTGIDRELMIFLLETAERYVRAGAVRSIRLSTRPDYISPEILEILSRYSVGVIELGLQSMDDAVLRASARGHTAADARKACLAVRKAGFRLVGQMMVGLPGATPKSELFTAHEICALGAEAVRIYPTVVFYHTPLEEQMRAGAYQPLSLEEAVARTAAVFRIFRERAVACIRIGLCATDALTSPAHAAAGPNHPALGEMVWNVYYRQLILERLSQAGLFGREVVIYVPDSDVSKAIGQRRANIKQILNETGTRILRVIGEQGRTEISVVPI